MLTLRWCLVWSPNRPVCVCGAAVLLRYQNCFSAACCSRAKPAARVLNNNRLRRTMPSQASFCASYSYISAARLFSVCSRCSNNTFSCFFSLHQIFAFTLSPVDNFLQHGDFYLELNETSVLQLVDFPTFCHSPHFRTEL